MGNTQARQTLRKFIEEQELRALALRIEKRREQRRAAQMEQRIAEIDAEFATAFAVKVTA